MPTLFETELRAQPDALARLVERADAEVAALRRLVGDLPVRGVVLAARGSSDNAARYARYLLPLVTGRLATPATPSLSTVYGDPSDLTGQVVVAVSQSGASPDVVSVLRDARAQGAPAVAVTNDPGSPLAREADHVLDLAAGDERSVAATGTYTTSLAALALVTAALAPRRRAAALLADLRAVPRLVDEAITLALAGEGVEVAAVLLAASRRGFAVGRGVNLATAHEAALKITELAGSLVVPFSPADLRHGPIGAAGPDTPTLLIAPDDPGGASVLELADELGTRGAPVVTIAPPGRSAPGHRVWLPKRVPAAVSPLVAVVPAQVLAWRVARARGVEVDAPAGLRKITLTS